MECSMMENNKMVSVKKGAAGTESSERSNSNESSPGVNDMIQGSEQIKFWTTEEDIKLLDMQESIGNKWATIAKFLPGRNETQAKNRFKSLSRAFRRLWTKEDDNLLLKLRKSSPPKSWEEIMKVFPNRTKNNIKKRYSLLLNSDGYVEPPAPGSPRQAIMNRKLKNPLPESKSSFTCAVKYSSDNETDDQSDNNQVVVKKLKKFDSESVKIASPLHADKDFPTTMLLKLQQNIASPENKTLLHPASYNLKRNYDEAIKEEMAANKLFTPPPHENINEQQQVQQNFILQQIPSIQQQLMFPMASQQGITPSFLYPRMAAVHPTSFMHQPINIPMIQQQQQQIFPNMQANFVFAPQQISANNKLFPNSELFSKAFQMLSKPS